MTDALTNGESSFRELAIATYAQLEAANDRRWTMAMPEEKAALVARTIVGRAGAIRSLHAVGWDGPDALANYLQDLPIR